MTFTCPYFRPDDEWCLLLKTVCVPGRPGCVLKKAKNMFLVPVEERIRQAEAARRKRILERGR